MKRKKNDTDKQVIEMPQMDVAQEVIESAKNEQQEEQIKEPVDEKNVDERIRSIGQELLATNLLFLEKVEKGEKIPEDDEKKYKETKKWFMELKKIYRETTRISKAKQEVEEDEANEGGDEDAFDADILEKIKRKKSTVASIKQDLK